MKRNRVFECIQSPNSGLIELDDQPPQPHDLDALEIALTTAAMLEPKPVSLLQTMRKTVVDSKPALADFKEHLVSTGGVLQTDSKPVGISVLCLERR